MKSIVLFAAVLRIILITAIISFAIIANAQNVALNTTGTPADASAMLDISSNSKGFLPPRMTTTQRTGIGSPANGLMVFDTDTKTYWYFSTAWKEINNAGGGSFSLPYSGVAESNFNIFSIHNTSNSFGSSAILGKSGSVGSGILPFYNMGVWGDNSGGIGVAGTSKTIGVFGGTGSADVTGIGVMGVNYANTVSNGAVTGINNANGVAVYAESTGGGTAVYGKTTKQNGAAIYGINNATQGHAIRGSATGNDGVAIYGEAGNDASNSYAGYFRNSNATNTKNVVQIDNLGTGNFLALTTGLGDVKTSIAKNGNINTDGSIYAGGSINSSGNMNSDANITADGTVSVRGNKGIVRNSNSNQLRIETLAVSFPAFHYSHYDSDFGPGGQTITVNFSTAFSSAPVVYWANALSGLLAGLSVAIWDVTTTSCKISILNYGPYDFDRNASTNKVVAIGNE